MQIVQYVLWKEQCQTLTFKMCLLFLASNLKKFGNCLLIVFDISNGMYDDYKFKISVCSIMCLEQNYKKIDLYKAYPCSFKDFVIREIQTFKSQNY